MKGLATWRVTNLAVFAGAAICLVACASTAPAETSPPTLTALASPSPQPHVTSTTAEASKAPPGSITVVMTHVTFNPANIVASGDPLLFYLVNPETSSAPHDMAIDEASGYQLTVSDDVQVGHAALFSVHGLPSGSYTIKCTVDGHAAEGMVGTLVVS